MPKGRVRPPAKTETSTGLPSLLPRKILTSPFAPTGPPNGFEEAGKLSTTKRSPLGAVRIWRGVLRPVAYSSTLNLGGACGKTPSGRGTRRPKFAADLVAKGFGS